MLDGYRGPGNCIWSQEFYETDRSRGFARGYTFDFSPGQGPVMCRGAGHADRWGAEHHRTYRKLFCHRTGMVAICEDLPEEHNSVMLDQVLKDSSGIPAPKITYTLSENSRRLLDHAVARGSERRGTLGANAKICAKSRVYAWRGRKRLLILEMGTGDPRSQASPGSRGLRRRGRD
jgi:hypothetical protein